jgi:hypothetical protein
MKTVHACASLPLESGGLDFDHAGPRRFVVISPFAAMPAILTALPWRKATTLGLAMLALSVSALAYSAGAQEDASKTKVPPAASSKPPLPPTRPTGLPPTSVTAPPSGTSGPAGAPTPPASQLDSSTKNPDARALPAEDPASNPYQVRTLPPASRARMHECGAEWQQMKATGAAGEKTWYTFAQTCLTR